MECVLPIRQGYRFVGEVFPHAADFGAIGSPGSCLGGRQTTYNMPGLRMALAVPGTRYVGSLRWSYMIQGIAGILRSWSMDQCKSDTFLFGNLHLWSMALCTDGMHCFGTLHMHLVALSECI